ncbi:MAG: YeeE/YedE family protein, partial [Acidobacteriota bacterium]|nr:YeeE/YedE family protein [Acidobacteriota bacterium]
MASAVRSNSRSPDGSSSRRCSPADWPRRRCSSGRRKSVADPAGKLLLGLLTGFAFGILLQKGQVTKYPVIVGQLLLRDFTVLKTMLTAVVTGGIGVYILKALGLASLHVKPAQLVAVCGGGVIFGVGMVILGYCPGTGVAAAAEGRGD